MASGRMTIFRILKFRPRYRSMEEPFHNDANDDTMDALVDALVTGPEAFRGSDPIDSFCGMWDTRV